MIKIKLDVTKLEKPRFFRGEKGIYCDLILVDSPNEYSDGFVAQSVTAEERQAGVKGPIVGNWSNLVKKASTPKPPPAKPKPHPSDDQVPF